MVIFHSYVSLPEGRSIRSSMCIHLFGSIILTVYDEMPLFCIRNLRWWWRNEGKTICCWISNLIYFGGLKPDVSFCSVELAPWLLLSYRIMWLGLSENGWILWIHGNIGKMNENDDEWGFPMFFSCFPYIFRYRSLITRWMNFRFGFPRCPKWLSSLVTPRRPLRSNAKFRRWIRTERLRPFSMVICWNWRSCPKNIQTYLNWLVAWNMNFIFPYIGKNHPNWLSYFSEGVGQPPTSKDCSINCCTANYCQLFFP